MTELVPKYYLYARFLPGVLTFFPVLISYKFLSATFPAWNLEQLFVNFHPYCGYVVLIPFLFLYTLFCREAGRLIEKVMLKNRTGLPTSYFLAYADKTFPESVKDRVRKLMLERYSLEMPTHDEEAQSYKQTISQLNHTSKYLAAFAQSSQDAQNQSAVYGFYRNLAGGGLIAVAISFVGLLTGVACCIPHMVQWMVISGLFYLTISLIITVRLLRPSAEDYAYKAIIYFIKQD